MGIPAIALYTSSPSSVYSTPHSCQINSHVSSDFDMSSRPYSAASSATSQKPFVGGLSCLFSSTSVKPAPSSSFSSGGEELGSLWHDRGEELKELSNSFCYSSSKIFGSSLKRDHSPVSVLHGPFSCSSTGIVTSRNSSVGFMRDRPVTMNLHSPIRSGIGGLFDGFVTNALGSCVDFSPSFSLPVGASSVIADELTFNLEDAFVGNASEPYARELLMSAQLRHKIFSDEFVVKAFYEAEKGHRGQMRASGDPYLHHCVETAVLLALIGANSTVVAAGLLHDTVDDSFLTYDYIAETFGSGVANLVQGVSKLSHLSKLARENNTASKSVEADRMHTMFLAMADARAVLIKLADRLHNMMTLEALPYAKQRRFAKETLEIFAPLANRLGISTWKEQLENLCFKHLYPQQYRELSSKLVDSFNDAMISSAIEKLEHALRDEGISYHILSGRHKSLYGIFSKMCKKKLTMNDVHDIHGLRLVVDKEEDCYKCLKIVHQLWPEVPGKLKDYITCPKFNGYKSLHTVVMDEGNVRFEVQIRTKEMHLQAEFGFAAHWRYKEGDSQHSAFVLQMVEWARWVVTWQCETMSKDRSCVGYTDSIKPPCQFPSHSDDCPYSYKSHCGQEGPVFVILIENDKMSVQEFPANSTVMNLLDRAGRGSSRWMPYNFPVKEELRPRINHEPVSDLTSRLNMGDVVELSPSIPDKSLMEYREEMKRMYDRGLCVSSASAGPVVSSKVGWGS